MPRKQALPKGMRKRGSVYYAAFQTKGRSVHKRLSSDLKTATELLKDLKVRADRGEFDLLDNDIRLAEIEKQWLKQATLECRPSTAQRYRENLANVKAGLYAKTAAQLNARSINSYREKRLAVGTSPRTINMEVGALSAMLNWAVQDSLIGSNPIEGIKQLSNDNPKKKRRSLEPEEVQAIFDNSPAYLRPVWRMLMTTGMRKGELIAMQFSWIDFDLGTVTIPAANAKGKEEREVPLDDEMIATLAELRDNAPFRVPDETGPAKVKAGKLRNFSKEHVFVTTSNTPWTNNLLTRFYAICKRAGVEGAHPNGSIDIHALRGSFITLAIDHGANPKAVQNIVGHKSERMTMGVYAKATERGKRAAVDCLPFAKVATPKHVVSLADHDGGTKSANSLASIPDTPQVQAS